jgi:hypothetical protein
MNEIIHYLIPILALTFLAAGWAAVQLLARKMKTKNHIDNAGGCCGSCGGGTCERKGLDLSNTPD